MANTPSQREKERERHTPLVFELERQKRLSPKWDAQTRAGLLSSRPATVKVLAIFHIRKTIEIRPRN